MEGDEGNKTELDHDVKKNRTEKLKHNHSVVVMETLMAPVSFCQKPDVLIFNPLK